MKFFMMGALSRAYHPGCKFDEILVIVGEQGTGYPKKIGEGRFNFEKEGPGVSKDEKKKRKRAYRGKNGGKRA